MKANLIMPAKVCKINPAVHWVMAKLDIIRLDRLLFWGSPPYHSKWITPMFTGMPKIIIRASHVQKKMSKISNDLVGISWSHCWVIFTWHFTITHSLIPSSLNWCWDSGCKKYTDALQVLGLKCHHTHLSKGLRHLKQNGTKRINNFLAQYVIASFTWWAS